ncbi:MAG: hypothetical protein A2Y93_07960 [Chloroflexi bacterium RBG_13_68_17]|nr:MAG: hypothetical protein A2Y93_07960 [Chloroflexi bacterium RBG_13_68_17]
MERRDPISRDSIFRVLAVTQGLWGERIATTVRERAPQDWQVETWDAPNPIPPIVDYPEDYLPPTLPQADLLLALGEVGGLAQLVPDICRLCGARAVIAPIDRNESLPPGLARQLKHWLEEMGVVSVFPKPFCSLTQETLNRKPIAAAYDHPLVQRFARAFGQPEFRTVVEGGQIARVDLVRDSPCGCARYVAERLPGTPVEDALEKAGMLHHHFPCLASMNQDADYHDTLMHVSGNVLRDALKDSLHEHLNVVYLRPSNLVEPDQPLGAA